MAVIIPISRKVCKKEWNLGYEEVPLLEEPCQTLDQIEYYFENLNLKFENENLTDSSTITDSDDEFYNEQRHGSEKVMRSMLSRVGVRNCMSNFFNVAVLMLTELVINLTVLDFVMLFLSLFMTIPAIKHTIVPYAIFIILAIKITILVFFCDGDIRKQLTSLKTMITLMSRLLTFSALLLLYPIATAGHITPLLEIISSFLVSLLFEIKLNAFASEFKLFEQVASLIFMYCTTMKALWENLETSAIPPFYTAMIGIVFLLLTALLSFGYYIIYTHDFN